MQSSAATLPTACECLPGRQPTHSAAPEASAYLPAAHSVQSLASELPTIAECLPNGHERQSDSSSFHLAATTQAPPHSASVSDTAVQESGSQARTYLPATHAMQPPFPVALAYVPAWQSTQSAAS